MVGQELAVDRVKWPTWSRAIKKASATFDASRARLNMLSPKKARPSTHAVDSADQRAVLPALDRMGLAAGVEASMARFDRAVDPGLRAVGAAEQDPGEIAVGGDREAPRPEPLGEAARQVEIVRLEDRPGPRLDPEQLVAGAVVGHREDPGGIAAQEEIGVERKAHRSGCNVPGRLPLPGGAQASRCSSSQRSSHLIV